MGVEKGFAGERSCLCKGMQGTCCGSLWKEGQDVHGAQVPAGSVGVRLEGLLATGRTFQACIYSS